MLCKISLTLKMIKKTKIIRSTQSDSQFNLYLICQFFPFWNLQVSNTIQTFPKSYKSVGKFFSNTSRSFNFKIINKIKRFKPYGTCMHKTSSYQSESVGSPKHLQFWLRSVLFHVAALGRIFEIKASRESLQRCVCLIHKLNTYMQEH